MGIDSPYQTVLRSLAAFVVLGLVFMGWNKQPDQAMAESAPKKNNSGQMQIEKNLENFDDLDFNVYSNQKWDELKRSHAPDILVHYPDGHTTKGLEQHVDELKPMFVFAPDTKIRDHPIKIAQGEWTSVVGTIEGTFTQPMPVGEGKTIEPTNKAFKLNMVTIGHWKSNVMDEEWLFWDNKALMQQMGIGH